MVVIGAGTGGTISGLGRKLKEHNPNVKIIGVDPIGSTIALPEELNETDDSFFEVDGIGFCFVSPVLDRSLVDKWVKVSDKEAMLMARKMIREEGLLVGNSSGAILQAALKAAKDLDEGQNVVIMLPDGIRNYMSTFLMDPWLEYRGYSDPPNKKNHWWWETPVRHLNLSYLYLVKEDDTCRKVLDNMEDNDLSYVGVLDSRGTLAGVVFKKNLVNKYLAKDIYPESSIKNVMLRQYLKVEENSPLGLLSRLFEMEDYVVVVSKNDTELTNFEIPLGVCQNSDVLKFVREKEIKTKKDILDEITPIPKLEVEIILYGKNQDGRSEGRL